MNELALLHNSLIIGALLFGLGLVGFLARRNMIIMFLCAEMMLQGVAVNLVAWGRYHNDWGGQMLVIMILTVAACEAGLALALIVMLYQRSGRLDIAAWSEIREDSLPAYQDIELDEFTATEQVYPTLTRSGVLPDVDPNADQQGGHRDQV